MPRKVGRDRIQCLVSQRGYRDIIIKYLQSLWQETEIIRGFTGLVHFGFRSRLDISCLGADISVKFQELLIFAETLSGSLRVSM